MRKINLFFIALMFLLIAVFSFNSVSCSGGVVIPDPVCEYGEITCETLNYICTNYPQVPPEICEYSNLACLALSVLCSSDPESSEYKAAETSLVYINQKLRSFVNRMHVNVK